MGQRDYNNAKTAVWWDINNCCQLPKGNNGVSILSTICDALTAVGCYEGPLSIIVCGDIDKLPPAARKVFFKSDITFLFHNPSAYFKDSHSFCQLISMMYCWAFANAPCNCMLISGDRYYSEGLMHLRSENVNVLLAHPHLRVSKDLTEAANHVWLWNSLLAGEPPYKSIPAAAAPSLDHDNLAQPPSDGPEV